MARTLFIAGKALEAKICEPWTGDKTLARKKKDAADQRSLFLAWAGSPRVRDWIRLEIYKIVLAKPRTFNTFNVTHEKAPQVTDRKDKLAAIEATDHTMARIAHLACSADSRVVLNMIFGTKKREAIDAEDLQPAALWRDLATVYVNNPSWDIKQIDILQLQETTNINGTNYSSSKIDVSQVQALGISAECTRLLFSELKAMYALLCNAVFGATGCNSVGEQFYGVVWTNYINGKFLYFKRPAVAMYVFKLWTECSSLPKYCIKELHESAVVRMGVRNDSGTRSTFALPVTPRGASQFRLTSPTPPSTPSDTGTHTSLATSSTHSMEVVASYFTMKMNQELKQEQQATLSVSSKVEIPEV